ncbi:MAG: hypothetical protein NVSMB70_02170 [Chamaesiphon sp.]
MAKQLTAEISTEQAKQTLNTLNSIPNNGNSYELDRDELIRLRDIGLMPMKLFVFLAIKMSFGDSPSINIETFCEDWEIENEADFHAAIAQLHKKRLLEPVARQLKLQFLTDRTE